MTSMMLGDSTLQSPTPSVNAPYDAFGHPHHDMCDTYKILIATLLTYQKAS
jgi:hypothetical protein